MIIMFLDRWLNRKNEVKHKSKINVGKLAEAISIASDEIDHYGDSWNIDWYRDYDDKNICKLVIIDDNIHIRISLYRYYLSDQKYVMYFDIYVKDIHVCKYEVTLHVKDDVFYKPWNVRASDVEYDMPEAMINKINNWADTNIKRWEDADKAAKQILYENEQKKEENKRAILNAVFEQYKESDDDVL